MPSESDKWGWKHVTVLGGFAGGGGSKRWRCNYCNSKHTGSHSRVRAHLLGLAGGGVKHCSAIDETLREEFRSLEEEQSNVASPPRTISKTELQDSTARFIYAESLSVKVINSPYFLKMAEAIAAFGSGYGLPSIDQLSDSFMSRQKTRTEQKMTLVKRLTSFGSGCTMVCFETNNVYDIYLFSPIGILLLDEHCISPADFSKEALIVVLNEAIKEVGEENVVQVILDFLEELVPGELKSLPLFPHIFVSSCCSVSIPILMDKIPAVRWIDHNTMPAVVLAYHGVESNDFEFDIDETPTSPLYNLIHNFGKNSDPLVKLAPSYCFVRKIVEQKEKLKEVVASEEWKHWKLTLTERVEVNPNDIERNILSDVFWAQAELVLEISEPFVTRLAWLNIDESTMGDIYNWRVQALDALSNNGVDKTILNKLEMIIEDSWCEHFSPLHALGYILNPKYFGTNQLNNELVMRIWESTLKRDQLDEAARSILDEQLRSYWKQDGPLGEEDAIDSRDKVDPVTWWETFGFEIPTLKTLAVKVLSQVSNAEVLHEIWVNGFLSQEMESVWGLERREDVVYLRKNVARKRNLDIVPRMISKEEVDDSIVGFFNADVWNYDVIDSPFFQDMAKAIAASGSGGDFPSTDELSDSCLNKEKARIEERMDSVGESWPYTGCTILSLEFKSNYNILVSSPGGNFFLEAAYITDDLPALALVSVLDEAIENVGPKNVVQVILDKAYAKNKSSELYHLSNFSHLFISPCASASIEILIYSIAKLILPHHDIEGRMNQYPSCPLITLIRSYMKSSDQRLYVPAPHINKLQKMFELKDELRKLVTSQEWEEWKLTIAEDNEETVSIKDDILDDNLWQRYQLMLQICEPFVESFYWLNLEELVMGDVYNWRVESLEAMRSQEIDKEMLEQLENMIEYEWKELFSPLQASGYMLNPKYFGRNQLRDKCLMQDWNLTLKRYESDLEARTKLRKQLSSYWKHEGRMGEEDAVQGRDKMDPVRWWESFGSEIPELQRLAIRILSQVSSAKLFYEILREKGYLYREKVQDFGVKNSEDLLFVRSNLTLQIIEMES